MFKEDDESISIKLQVNNFVRQQYRSDPWEYDSADVSWWSERFFYSFGRVSHSVQSVHFFLHRMPKVSKKQLYTSNMTVDFVNLIALLVTCSLALRHFSHSTCIDQLRNFSWSSRSNKDFFRFCLKKGTQKDVLFSVPSPDSFDDRC